MSDLMQKLMVSKQIMDRHNQMPRGQASSGGFNSQLSERIPPVMNYNETPIPATYNIPEEFLQPTQSVQPKQVPVTEDRIKNSKLPDAIKKLMIEHPIQQPQSHQPTISNEIIEKAARLMGENKQTVQSSQASNQTQTSYGLNASDIKKIVRETVEEVLSENGLMVESTQKTNEIMVIKVGKHIFEGKISKIKKTV